jgi:hypothetical protein
MNKMHFNQFYCFFQQAKNNLVCPWAVVVVEVVLNSVHRHVNSRAVAAKLKDK